MTDHRIMDLSHGHLGEATYDPDEHTWTFTKQTSLENHVHPIQDTQSCLFPALRIFDDSKYTPKNLQSQSQCLKKIGNPQILSALSVVKDEILEDAVASQAENARTAIISSLLAYGPAANIVARNRPQSILAMVTGEGGQVLRLLKPQIGTFGWKSHSGVNLKIAEAEKGEDGYWIGNGGAIHQITFAEAMEGSSSWLAVRQSSITTIFRPLYGQDAVPANIPRGYPGKYPASRLQANPLATLPIARTGNASHVDVSFNPWYVRQIAVLDQRGHWSIWDIEGSAKNRRNTYVFKAYRDGFVLDDYIPEPGVLLPDSGDGWGKVMWCGGVNTLVTCSRRHIAVFDLGSSSRRLHSPDLFKGIGAGWILDAKRSPVDPNHLVVLTSTRLVYLSIDPDNGAHVILSNRHFRDPGDDTLKLHLLADEAVCIALLYSSVDSLVDSYRLTSSVEETIAPVLSKSSLELSPTPELRSDKDNNNRQTTALCVLPCAFSVHSRNQGSGLGQRYYELGVRFYQIYSLDQGLGLNSTLSASITLDPGNSNGTPQLIIPTPPTIRMVNSIQEKSSRKVIDDEFISQNGAAESEDDEAVLESLRIMNLCRPSLKKKHGSQSRSRPVHLQPLPDLIIQTPPFVTTLSIASYGDHLIQRLVSDHKARASKVASLLELAEFHRVLVEDLDETALTLRSLIESVAHMKTEGGNTELKIIPVSTVDRKVLLGDLNFVTSIYDHLVDIWISNLPKEAPGMVRLSKERQIRNIATELYLCCQSLTPAAAAVDLDMDFQEVDDPHGFGESSASQAATPARRFTTPEAPSGSLPTPRPTPSSEDGDSSSRKLQEEPAVTRLRQYAISVPYHPSMNKKQNRMLDQWPSVTGEDPKQYKWQPMTNIEADDGSHVSRKREKDEARRRKRAERMLSRASTMETMSQPMPTLPWASQPMIHNVMSSQIVPDEMPMTQTEPGVFGGRSIGQPSKKKKRKVAGFR